MTIQIPHLGALAAEKPADESSRLEDLRALEILDTEAEERFDRLTELVARVLKVPMSGISFVDEERQWFKSAFGFMQRETPRALGFCQHAILESDMLIVEDATRDRRFASNPMVQSEPHLRFYAGAVIRSRSGRPLGTCFALGTSPRQLADDDKAFLRLMARMVEAELEMRLELETLQHQTTGSFYETETGLPNLDTFRQRVDSEIAKARKHGSMLLLASMQIEGFDAFEAALGRDGAIYVTSILAGRVREQLDPPCFLAQIRDDEVAVLTHLADAAHAQSTMNRLLSCAESPLLVGEHHVPVVLRSGASIFPVHADNGASLIKRARTALWSLPRTDKSNFRLYRRKLSDIASVEFRIATALQGAIENGEFNLLYQPQIDLRRSVTIGAEALIRWTSATLGDVSPAKFIPIAEKTLKIIEIGEWVLRATCRQLAPGGRLRRHMPQISVNVTSHQLTQKGFTDFVARTLEEYAVPGECLNVEITESTLVRDVKNAVRAIRKLRDLGVRISIDDFGTGFSSLSYLTRLPIQVLKIDRSFIRNVTTHKESKKIVRSIVSMGHDLELEVVAEGVETVEQLDFLRSIGCDLVQGFLFSPPLAPADFADRLDSPAAADEALFAGIAQQ